MTDYRSIPGLESVYLEDSWVLDVIAHPRSLLLCLDVVLEPGHPDYGPLVPGEQYKYERAHLAFRNVASLGWRHSGAPAAFDSSGQRDYGSIDSFTWNGGNYSLEGLFGSISVECDPPTLKPVEDDEACNRHLEFASSLSIKAHVPDEA